MTLGEDERVPGQGHGLAVDRDLGVALPEHSSEDRGSELVVPSQQPDRTVPGERCDLGVEPDFNPVAVAAPALDEVAIRLLPVGRGLRGEECQHYGLAE